MFQFSGFPSIHYGFMHGSQVLHLRGFPIRKSADRSLFAAPRSLSQLVTSFFGSWCQGIHLMLFLAWTSSFSSSLKKIAFAFFAWVSQIIDWLLSSLLKRPFTIFAFLTICSIFVTQLTERPYFKSLLIRNLTDSIKSFSIICSFLYFLLFGFQWTFLLVKYLNLTGGLKWTRTTDLALIRRAL